MKCLQCMVTDCLLSRTKATKAWCNKLLYKSYWNMFILPYSRKVWWIYCFDCFLSNGFRSDEFVYQVGQDLQQIYHIRSNFWGMQISRKAGIKDFCGLFFTDHQVEYICFLKALLFFEDEYFMVNQHTAKSAKFMSLKNYCVYTAAWLVKWWYT